MTDEKDLVGRRTGLCSIEVPDEYVPKPQSAPSAEQKCKPESCQDPLVAMPEIKKISKKIFKM